MYTFLCVGHLRRGGRYIDPMIINLTEYTVFFHFSLLHVYYYITLLYILSRLAAPLLYIIPCAILGILYCDVLRDASYYVIYFFFCVFITRTNLRVG